MSIGQKIVEQFEKVAGVRSNWENQWDEVARKIWPERANFLSHDQIGGEKKNQEVFDSTSALALTKWSSAMESILTPRTQRWHTLSTGEDDLDNDVQIKRYLEQVTNILFRVRYSPKSSFSSQTNECYQEQGAFGTGCVFVDEMPGIGLRYKSIHLAELYLCENSWGIIDKVYRKYRYTARQAIERFGDKVSEKIKGALEKGSQEKFTFIHYVAPAEDEGRFAFESFHIELEHKTVVQKGGYYTMPYCIGRVNTSPDEVYGRGPGMMILPEQKTLNEMSKTNLRIGQRVAEPPLLTADGVLKAFNMRSNALNHGYLDNQGRPKVAPLNVGGSFNFALEEREDRRKVINDAFLVTLFQILVEQPSMTATEAMLRAQEKGQLLAPMAGRQQSELLGSIIERELDLLGRAGMLPEMPEKLVEMGGEVNINYTSPVNRMQRAEDGVAILRTLDTVMPMAQIDPSILDIFNMRETAKELADINGVPAKLLRTAEEVAALESQREQEKQLMQAVEAAPAVANTVKTVTEAANNV